MHTERAIRRRKLMKRRPGLDGLGQGPRPKARRFELPKLRAAIAVSAAGIGAYLFYVASTTPASREGAKIVIAIALLTSSIAIDQAARCFGVRFWKPGGKATDTAGGGWYDGDDSNGHDGGDGD